MRRRAGDAAAAGGAQRLRRAFAARCAALLATDAAEAECLRVPAGRLYEARSISIHGGRLDDYHDMVEAAAAQQLEDLVAALTGQGPDVQWFTREGRGFRNTMGHGRWEAADDAPVDWLVSLVSALLPALLERWNAAPAGTTARPSDLLIERATALHRGTAT